MNLVLYTAPTIEPISLAEAKEHLRLDTESLADALTTTQSILPGSHAIANNYTTHAGTGVEVIGKRAIVNLNAGTVGAGGTVDAKIQESDDNATYTDVTSGAFTQVTAANDNAIQEKEYTGTKRYIRVVAKVLVAACEFGADIITESGETSEETLLTALIQASREHVEAITRRALLTQIWDLYLDRWPSGDAIVLPFGNLQNGVGTAPVVSWKDTDGTETTLTVTTDYLVEENGEGCGRIVLPYGEGWPSGSLYPSNPIKVRFVCGWTAAASVPERIRAAVKMILADLFANREAQATANTMRLFEENRTVQNLLASCRLWWKL